MARITKAPEERRQELIVAAMELFWEQGYEQTMVSDIVKRVGVAQGLFYYYFSSKEDIFLATIDQFIQMNVEEFAQLLRDETLSPLARMHNVVRALDTFLSKVDQTGTLERARMRPEMQLRVQHHVMSLMEPVLERALIQGHRQGVLDAPEPQYMARFLLAGFVAVATMPDAPPAEAMRNLALDYVARLFKLSDDARADLSK